MQNCVGIFMLYDRKFIGTVFSNELIYYIHHRHNSTICLKILSLRKVEKGEYGDGNELGT